MMVEVHQQVAALPGHPLPRRVSGDPGQDRPVGLVQPRSDMSTQGAAARGCRAVGISTDSARGPETTGNNQHIPDKQDRSSSSSRGRPERPYANCLRANPAALELGGPPAQGSKPPVASSTDTAAQPMHVIYASVAPGPEGAESTDGHGRRGGERCADRPEERPADCSARHLAADLASQDAWVADRGQRDRSRGIAAVPELPVRMGANGHAKGERAVRVRRHVQPHQGTSSVSFRCSTRRDLVRAQGPPWSRSR
jgi:hypothetical protein